MSRRRILRECSVIALFALLAVALTWPLAANLSTAVNDLGDPLLVAWILDWVCHALVHQPLDLYSAPILYPGILPLAYSENLIAVALLVLPLQLAGASPVTLHNVAYLLGFALSGYGAFVLSRLVTRNTIAAFVGGIFYAFCAYKFDHVAHLHIIFSPFVPLLLAALLAFRERPTLPRGALLTLAWVANGLSNIYFLMFSGVTVLLTVALLAVIQPRGWKFHLKLALSTALAVLILVPFLLPYRTVSKTYDMVRTEEEVRSGSASWMNWLVPGRLNRMYGRVARDNVYEAERQLFPGLLVVFLAGTALLFWKREETRPSAPPPVAAPRPLARLALDVGIVAALTLAWATTVSDRIEIKVGGTQLFAADSPDIPVMAALVLALIRFARPLRAAAARSRFNEGAWVAALWIAVGILGSFGLDGFLYTFFYRRFEPFQAMRVAARFAIIAYVGLAVWGAMGAAAIVEARQGRKRIIAGGLLLLLMVADVVPRLRWELAPLDVPPVYSWLAKTKAGPVLEMPFSENGVDYLYLLGSAEHRVPIVNGTSGFFPPDFWRLRDPDSRDAFDEMLAVAEELGVRVIVVHGGYLGERRAKTVYWLRQNLAHGRLAFLRSFDNGTAGDYAFAITKNFPSWKKLEAPEIPDGGGFLPQHTLERFLAGKSVHSEATIVNMDHPLPYMTIKGPLRVSGWTLSPHGVRRATVYLHMRTRRYEAKLVPRGDVLEAYPWYRYFNSTPGFELMFDERPRGIPMDTSLQVEVEDHAGRVQRGRDLLIRWE